MSLELDDPSDGKYEGTGYSKSGKDQLRSQLFKFLLKLLCFFESPKPRYVCSYVIFLLTLFVCGIIDTICNTSDLFSFIGELCNNILWYIFSFIFWIFGYYWTNSRNCPLQNYIFSSYSTPSIAIFIGFFLFIITYLIFALLLLWNDSFSAFHCTAFPPSISKIVFYTHVFGSFIFSLTWGIILLIFIALCTRIKQNWKHWKTEIQNEIQTTFNKQQFKKDYEESKEITHYLSFFLLCLNFHCITYISVGATLIFIEFRDNRCGTVFCTPTRIWYVIYKIFFFFIANWMAAEVTSAEHRLMEGISYTMAFDDEKNLTTFKNLKYIHLFLTDADRLGKLGFNIMGISLTRRRIHSMVSICVTLAVLVLGVSSQIN